MTKEKKKWLMQTAAVIKAIVAKHKYSEAALDVDPDNPLFNDSCNFVGLVRDLQVFAATLENMVKYSVMSENV